MKVICFKQTIYCQSKVLLFMQFWSLTKVYVHLNVRLVQENGCSTRRVIRRKRWLRHTVFKCLCSLKTTQNCPGKQRSVLWFVWTIFPVFFMHQVEVTTFFKCIFLICLFLTMDMTWSKSDTLTNKPFMIIIRFPLIQTTVQALETLWYTHMLVWHIFTL